MRASAASGAAAVAAAGALVLALITPATHGTFSAGVDTAGVAGVTPFLTCAAAAVDEQRRGALVFAYPLDEPVETTEATDRYGVAGPAKYTGERRTARPTRGGCLRDRGSVWAPDGGSSGLTTPDVTIEPRFTFEIRFRTEQSDAVIAAISPQGSDRPFSLALVRGAVQLLAPGGGPMVQGGSGLGDGAWHHLALVVGEDAIRLYLDSAAQDPLRFSLTDRFGASWRLAVGGEADGHGLPSFRGGLAWAELTNRALTADEVHAHDLAGRTPPSRRIVRRESTPVGEVPARTADPASPADGADATAERAAPAGVSSVDVVAHDEGASGGAAPTG